MMVSPERIQQAINLVNDQTSFIKELLYDALQWPVDGGIEKVEDISFAWTDQELNAEGLERYVIDGQVWQIQPLRQKQPWGIFLLDFKNIDAFIKGRGLTGPLRKVLRGLVSRRRKANMPMWQRENLLFICTHDYKYFHFGYFKAPKETKTAPLITFGWGPDTPARTACEFNLPALEWPQDPDNVEAWQEQWQRAFDKEKLTKDFFKIFAYLYHQVVDNIAEVRELKSEAGKLAQLLLDRMLFLYFIQRKGWLDQKLDYLYSRFVKCWNKDPDGHSYYSSVLYPLFLSLSNTNFSAPEIGSVPFLNGGLFEETSKQSQAEQIAHARLKVKNSTFKLIFDELLERFNFTVTEDTPLDVEVAIDPEMLGKIFESLILQLEKEPEKDLRKLTGSYYTPRPIVHFMCQEALKEYLVAQLAAEDNAKIPELEDLLNLPQADQMDHEQIETLKGLFESAEAKILRQAILDCRICDPAVGSGAFPVGMLHEMVAAIARLDLSVHGRDILNQHNYYYDLKKQIIESCLYGVDIQEQPVKLCELRLWLSLVVDYQIDSSKSFDQSIREVPSLPNLSYRIMRGDSLLERLFGHVIQLNEMARDAKTKQLIDSIQADKQAYFREGNNDEKRRLELKILAKQADLAERLIEAKKSALSYTANIFGEEETKAKDRKAKAEHEQRLADLADLKSKVAGAKVELERLASHKKGVGQGDIETLRRQYFHTGDAPTFIWRVDFAEIFSEKGGFDVVIGNPPYVRQEKLKDQKKVIAQQFQTYTGIADLYVYFYEKGIKLLKPGGTIAYISSNKFFKAGYGKKLRRFLTEKAAIISLIDFGDLPVFEATTYPCVLVAKRLNGESVNIMVRARTIASEDELRRFEDVFRSSAIEMPQSSLSAEGWRIEGKAVLALLEKIKKAGVPLDEYVKGKIYYGIKTGYNEAFVIDEETKKRLIKKDKRSAEVIKPFLRGRDIKRYSIKEPGLYLIYVPCKWTNEHRGKAEPETFFKKELPSIHAHLKPFEKALKKRDDQGEYWWEMRPCKYLQEFEKPKIFLQGLMIEPSFTLSLKGHYLNAPANFIGSDEPYLLGLLNSRLLWFFHKNLTISVQQGFLRIYVYNLEKLPIVRPTEAYSHAIVQCVKKILAAKKSDPKADTSLLSDEIDRLVYELYGLTKEEIDIVKGVNKAN